MIVIIWPYQAAVGALCPQLQLRILKFQPTSERPDVRLLPKLLNKPTNEGFSYCKNEAGESLVDRNLSTHNEVVGIPL